MRLLLVRHGDAHAGLHGTIAGRTACRGLTDLGRHQARCLADAMRRDTDLADCVLVTSTLPRAIETAALLAPALGVDTVAQDGDLCEVDPGDADGLDYDEHARRWGRFDMAAEPDRVFAPNGDSWNSFHQRVGSVLARLAATYPDQTVVAVCHGGVIVASVALLLTGATTTAARLTPSNTGVTDWRWDPPTRRWTLHAYNVTAHLADARAGVDATCVARGDTG